MSDYCNDCGRLLSSSEETVWVFPVSIYSIYGNFSSKYAEPVCEDCCDKFYVECAECGYYHHKDCCKQDEHGNWICDLCRIE